MAPGLKTYRNKKASINKSIDVFNALFAENLMKRKRNKLLKTALIKDLPDEPHNPVLLDDSVSLVVNTNSTFDRLLREEEEKRKDDNIFICNESYEVRNRSKSLPNRSHVNSHSQLDTHTNIDSSSLRQSTKCDSNRRVLFRSNSESEIQNVISFKSEYCENSNNDTASTHIAEFNKHFEPSGSVITSTPCKPHLPKNNRDSKLLEESMRQIEGWSFRLPEFESTRCASRFQSDWKLKCSPHVLLKQAKFTVRKKRELIVNVTRIPENTLNVYLRPKELRVEVVRLPESILKEKMGEMRSVDDRGKNFSGSNESVDDGISDGEERFFGNNESVLSEKASIETGYITRRRRNVIKNSVVVDDRSMKRTFNCDDWSEDSLRVLKKRRVHSNDSIFPTWSNDNKQLDGTKSKDENNKLINRNQRNIQSPDLFSDDSKTFSASLNDFESFAKVFYKTAETSKETSVLNLIDITPKESLNNNNKLNKFNPQSRCINTRRGGINRKNLSDSFFLNNISADRNFNLEEKEYRLSKTGKDATNSTSGIFVNSNINDTINSRRRGSKSRNLSDSSFLNNNPIDESLKLQGNINTKRGSGRSQNKDNTAITTSTIFEISDINDDADVRKGGIEKTNQSNSRFSGNVVVDESVKLRKNINTTRGSGRSPNKKNNGIADDEISDINEDADARNGGIEKTNQSNSRFSGNVVVDERVKLRKNINTIRGSGRSPNKKNNGIANGVIFEISDIEETFLLPKTRLPYTLKPGKSWKRSLMVVKNSFLEKSLESFRLQISNGHDYTKWNPSEEIRVSVCRKSSVKIIPKNLSGGSPQKILENSTSYAPPYAPAEIVQSSLAQYFEGLSVNNPAEEDLSKKSLLSIGDSINETSLGVFAETAKDIVLRKCGQTEPLPFTECYPDTLLKNCHKIGEGVFGEVFLFRNRKGTSSVMKVIPIEGDLIVNGERQKKFEEILTEITIAMELSNLRQNKKNSTGCFNEVEAVHCVKGKYPLRLLDLWDLYDEDRSSENDCPSIFGADQLYIVLELSNGGKDLESFVFNNAKQAYALFQQVACALAVAESALQFEHRDLHWGNVLISPTDKDASLIYNLHGRQINIATQGVQVSIIDFTLSRITADNICIYNDLGQDPDLFDAEGDYQFEIYRLMQKYNNNEWEHFEPYTNILWLHYMLDKMITAVRYKYAHSKCHSNYIFKLKQLKKDILEFKSTEEFVSQTFI